MHVGLCMRTESSCVGFGPTTSWCVYEKETHMGKIKTESHLFWHNTHIGRDRPVSVIKITSIAVGRALFHIHTKIAVLEDLPLHNYYFAIHLI